MRKTELKPHVKAVREWLDQRSRRNVWEMLDSRFDKLDHEATDYLRRYANGHPTQKHLRQAYEIIERVNLRDDRREALLAVMATGYLHDLDTKRFAGTTDAFSFQLARIFRSFAPSLSVGVSWDQENQRTRQHYRDAPAKTLRTLGALLMETGIPHFGSVIATKELEERQRRQYREEDALAILLGHREGQVGGGQ